MTRAWDLHCDTLSVVRQARLRGEHMEFGHNTAMVDLERLKESCYLLQCFACYVNLEQADGDPLVPCLEMADLFYEMLEKHPEELMQVRSPEDVRALPGSGRTGVMLTVEEGQVCMGRTAILRDLYRLGVRMMTLTWNHENTLAFPNRVNLPETWTGLPDERGLKETGIRFLEEMERLHMIVDVSHLSDGGFRDVAAHTKRPFVASHSNARAVCPHVRNLTDGMIRMIAERGGLIGLNFYGHFLDPGEERSHVRSRLSDMAAHAGHILNIGGEDVLALGSDFDGIDGDLELKGAQDMPLLAGALEKAGFTARQIDKMFSGNALRFFEENL